MIKEYPPIPVDAKLFQNGYKYEPIVGEVTKWEWSVTFGCWSALVTFQDGWHGWTYPKPPSSTSLVDKNLLGNEATLIEIGYEQLRSNDQGYTDFGDALRIWREDYGGSNVTSRTPGYKELKKLFQAEFRPYRQEAIRAERKALRQAKQPDLYEKMASDFRKALKMKPVVTKADYKPLILSLRKSK